MKSKLFKGITFMVFSSVLTCIGQLCWKISTLHLSIIFAAIGLFLYGCGALIMIVALRYGDLSVLHPMLSTGYVLSIALGSIVLKESITITKVLGIAVIIVGLVLISSSKKSEEKA